jgi:hypothetical protein
VEAALLDTGGLPHTSDCRRRATAAAKRFSPPTPVEMSLRTSTSGRSSATFLPGVRRPCHRAQGPTRLPVPCDSYALTRLCPAYAGACALLCGRPEPAHLYSGPEAWLVRCVRPSCWMALSADQGSSMVRWRRRRCEGVAGRRTHGAASKTWSHVGSNRSERQSWQSGGAGRRLGRSGADLVGGGARGVQRDAR